MYSEMVEMDTSEEYIRKCLLARKIQYKWKYENGDYVYDTMTEMQAYGIGIIQKM